MKKIWMRICAAAVLLAALMAAENVSAEERRVGDYIYVPMVDTREIQGTISLRVEGLALNAAGEQERMESLSGAEFGVYVFSSDGSLRPWANPLYPNEPMRIRTGEGQTRFTLPQGTEFFLRQETAPEGYLFDDQALIPVDGDELLVVNAVPGQLVLSAVDTAGEPIPGVTFEMIDEAGRRQTLVSDDRGCASVRMVGGCSVAEESLPAGVVAAARAEVDGQETETADGRASVSIEAATRRELTYVHPAAGSLQLKVSFVSIGDGAERRSEPLQDARLELLDGSGISAVTDERGEAFLSLPEGVYQARLTCESEPKATLLDLPDRTPVPLESVMTLYVNSGETTNVELDCIADEGRIAFEFDCERRTAGGSVTVESAQTGEQFGPYAFDAEGMAVTAPLAAGEYFVSAFEIPENTVFSSAFAGENRTLNPIDWALEVRAGEATWAGIELLTQERQKYALSMQTIDEQGEPVRGTIGGELALELIDVDGVVVGSVSAADGEVLIEGLSGTYALRMQPETAAALGAQQQSAFFELPSDDESICFLSDRTRLILVCLDEEGRPVPGAEYTLMDAEGRYHDVEPDLLGDGETLTPPIPSGETWIEMSGAPENHAAAQGCFVSAASGEAMRVEMAAPSHGMLTLFAGLQKLDERGDAKITALPNADVTVRAMREDGSAADMMAELTTDPDGFASIQLPAGLYAAELVMNGLPQGLGAPEMAVFKIADTESVEASLLARDALGGVRVLLTGGELDAQQLAQARFELVDVQGQATELSLIDGAFYAGNLIPGEYALCQRQMAEGYVLAADRTVSVTGGVVSTVRVATEEYALLTISKNGLTFNQQLQSFVVPLSGEYGIYTLIDGEMTPYPSAEKQTTLWANIASSGEGRSMSARLPAEADGTTYYIHELGAASGFASDDAYHEIVLRAGEDTVLNCTVSSDRGFFVLDTVNASTGEHLSGGAYELVLESTGESVLRFEMGDAPYQNAMAIPVGSYVLRQLKAAEGYALSVQAEQPVEIEPYLTRGGTMAGVQMDCLPIPQDAELGILESFYADRTQDLTFVSASCGRLSAAESLICPQFEMRFSADARLSIAGLVLSGAGDEAGTPYAARVEYCLVGGGWQPSDARVTDVLGAPAALSLADIPDDIVAIRVTYFNVETGEERVGGGFTPGSVAVNLRVESDGETEVQAEASFSGRFVYRTALGAERAIFVRRSERAERFAVTGDGAFGPVPAGRDGRVSGVVFFDDNADGFMSAGETLRYAGMTVSLISESGEVISTCRTGTDGRYCFEPISGGVYAVQFDGGDHLVFSGNADYSALCCSGVEDTRYGTSAALVFDGAHSDYVVNAGCVYAAHIGGKILRKTQDGTIEGYEGIAVELSAESGADDEPIIVYTREDGSFSVGGLLPGVYSIQPILMPDELVSSGEAQFSARTHALEQGEEFDCGVMIAQAPSSISGVVRIDEDGDGVLDENAKPLAGVSVALLFISDGHSEAIAHAITGDDGAYAFENLFDGEYSVLFQLPDEWTFTRYGDFSSVYGAVSQSGSTKNFVLKPGEALESVHAGATRPTSLTVTVFRDTQIDGLMNGSDTGLSGVRISLIALGDQGEDAETISLMTDKEGNVVFEGVSPGQYALSYQMPGLWRATKNPASTAVNAPATCVPQSAFSSGRSAAFTLGMGQSEAHLYIGAMLSGSISGVVYFDDNADAKKGDEEQTCEGVKVELLEMDGSVTAQVVTDAQGAYAFEGLLPRRYRVRFSAREDCGFSGTERSMTRFGVQPSEDNVSMTRVIPVSAGSDILTADAGVVRMATITGSIWEDRNADCEMGEDERLLPGVLVQLMNSSGRMLVASAETDAYGTFTFDRVQPGVYCIRVTPPEDYEFSGAWVRSPLAIETRREGKAYSNAFQILGGAHVEGIAYGVLTLGAISGSVWQDIDYDGIWDDGEYGLRDVQVALLDANGSELAQTQTYSSGDFRFAGLKPGAYALAVRLPSGYVYTTPGKDSAAGRSDDPPTRIELDELGMGAAMDGVRIGALQSASIGGMVWMDADSDGRRQSSDAGVPNVNVQLAVVNGADSGRVLTTRTDEEGNYSFTGVMPGNAILSFDLPEGYAFTKNANGVRRVSVVPERDDSHSETQPIAIETGVNRTDLDVGLVGVGVVNGAVWLDSDYNGLFDAKESGIPAAKVRLMDAQTGMARQEALTDENGGFEFRFVRQGEYALKVELPDGMIFTRSGESAVPMLDIGEGQTQSFELAMGQSRTDICVGAIIPGSISGKIVVDENEDGRSDASEAALENVNVAAVEGGTIIAATQTGEDGEFILRNLRPGTFRLRYSLPASALFSVQTTLRLADRDAQEAETDEYRMAMGDQIDAGTQLVVLAAEIDGLAWIDENADGKISGGENWMSGVQVELLDERGETLAQAKTGDSGAYAFRKLRRGEYSLRFTLPTGMLFADHLEGEEGSCVPVVSGGMGSSNAFLLEQGESKRHMNVGGIRPGSIGDSVWLDVDGNGLQDYEEPLIPGVEIALYSVDLSGNASLQSACVSDEYGYYRFAELRPGRYILRVTLEEGDRLTKHIGSPLGEIDSDVNPETAETEILTLPSGKAMRNIDIGFLAR